MPTLSSAPTLTVDFAPVFNAVDDDLFHSVVDRKQHSVIADSQAVAEDSSQFFNLRRARADSQLLDALEDEAALRCWEGAQILIDAPVVTEIVHELEKMLAFQACEEGSMGEGSRTCLNRLFEIDSIFQVLDEVDKPPVIGQRQDDLLRLPHAVHQESFRFHVKCNHPLSSGAKSITGTGGNQRSVEVRFADLI